MRALLEWWTPGHEAPVDAYADLDLDAFLRATARTRLPEGERLRRLAIFLEEQRLLPERFGRDAWPPLDRVLRAALAASPGDVDVLSSRAAAALACAEACDADPDLLGVATALGREAVEAAPDDAHAWYVLGQVRYASEEPGSLEEALACFSRSAELDPTHGWAPLYVAHVLQDLGRWSEAAEAYRRVPFAAFRSPSHRWRLRHAQEQRAHCLLQAGERKAAVVAFVALARWWARVAREPDRASEALLFLGEPERLYDAADGALAPELGARVARLRAGLEREPDA